MTATLYTSHTFGRSVVRTAPRVRTPNYALRRAVAVTVAILAIALLAIAASALVGAVADVGGRPAAASDVASAAAPIVRVHVAQSGDTLWSIADRYRGDIDQGRFVDALIDLNGGTVIQVGQAVRLP